MTEPSMNIQASTEAFVSHSLHLHARTQKTCSARCFREYKANANKPILNWSQGFDLGSMATHRRRLGRLGSSSCSLGPGNFPDLLARQLQAALHDEWEDMRLSNATGLSKACREAIAAPRIRSCRALHESAIAVNSSTCCCTTYLASDDYKNVAEISRSGRYLELGLQRSELVFFDL